MVRTDLRLGHWCIYLAPNDCKLLYLSYCWYLFWTLFTQRFVHFCFLFLLKIRVQCLIFHHLGNFFLVLRPKHKFKLMVTAFYKLSQCIHQTTGYMLGKIQVHYDKIIMVISLINDLKTPCITGGTLMVFWCHVIQMKYCYITADLVDKMWRWAKTMGKIVLCEEQAIGKVTCKRNGKIANQCPCYYSFEGPQQAVISFRFKLRQAAINSLHGLPTWEMVALLVKEVMTLAWERTLENIVDTDVDGSYKTEEAESRDILYKGSEKCLGCLGRCGKIRKDRRMEDITWMAESSHSCIDKEVKDAGTHMLIWFQTKVLSLRWCKRQ